MLRYVQLKYFLIQTKLLPSPLAHTLKLANLKDRVSITILNPS